MALFQKVHSINSHVFETHWNNEEYFQYISEDLKDEEIESKRTELRKLCGSFVEE